MKIAVLDDYAGMSQDLADWSGLGEVVVFRDTLHDPDALAARLVPFQALCIMRERTKLPASLLSRLPNLRLIVTSGQRNRGIDLAAAQAQGITVCGTNSRNTTTAELAMAMMLTLSRRIIPESQCLAAGHWQQGLGRDLSGLTLGLIGLGRIGAQMTALGRAFGMDITAWSPNLTEERCSELGVRRAPSLPALMGAADVVSVHVLLSERSRGLVGAEAFAAARPGQVFLNTSRGPIVDSAALIAGLRAGRPEMAGLDVFDTEPLPSDDPVIAHDLIAEGRLLLTPHLGYTVRDSFALYYREQVEAVRAFQSGAPIRVIEG